MLLMNFFHVLANTAINLIILFLIGKKSLLKLKEEQALKLYTLEEARLRAEIKAFQAQETYYQEKNEREQELHSINIAILKKQLK